MENQKPLKKKRRRPRKVKQEVKPEIKETFTFSCKCSRHHQSESDCNAEETEVVWLESNGMERSLGMTNIELRIWRRRDHWTRDGKE
jgi:hypothetical protein